jgi:hypothetical protein
MTVALAYRSPFPLLVVVRGLDCHHRYAQSGQGGGEAANIVAHHFDQHLLPDLSRQPSGAFGDGGDQGRIALGGEHTLEPVGDERRVSVRTGERLLQHTFHRRSELTAIDQYDTGHVVRCLQGGLDDDPASRAVTDQHGRRQAERPHYLCHISAIAFNRALVWCAGACAVSAQIDRDGLEACGKMRYLRVPVAVCAGEAMHEHDWRTALACYDVMDEWHYHPVKTDCGQGSSDRLLT